MGGGGGACLHDEQARQLQARAHHRLELVREQFVDHHQHCVLGQHLLSQQAVSERASEGRRGVQEGVREYGKGGGREEGGRVRREKGGSMGGRGGGGSEGRGRESTGGRGEGGSEQASEGGSTGGRERGREGREGGSTGGRKGARERGRGAREGARECARARERENEREAREREREWSVCVIERERGGGGGGRGLCARAAHARGITPVRRSGVREGRRHTHRVVEQEGLAVEPPQLGWNLPVQ